MTGSSGHLGEVLAHILGSEGYEVVRLDPAPSPQTQVVGSIEDKSLVQHCVEGVDAIIHIAALHKPHVGTHSREEFVATNVVGTLNLLQAAVAANVRTFVMTSTTSLYGLALVPPPGAPATWITEEIEPIPKNIYGATKCAAEDLCWLFHLDHGIDCIVLRTSRFFPEPDDYEGLRQEYDDANIKVNPEPANRLERPVASRRSAIIRHTSATKF